MTAQDCLAALSRTLKHSHMITHPDQLARLDKRHNLRGHALAIVYPSITEDIQKIVHTANHYHTPIICLGGNTSCSAATLPSLEGDTLLLDLSRLNHIRNIDVENQSVCCEAGTTLASLNEALAPHGLYFPIELASEKNCTIGGNIATNAGGLSAVQYGMVREHVLGLEVVLPDGSLFSELSTLRKNNNGYAIKQLFIGSEGTLGIITQATLRCTFLPQYRHMALITDHTLHGLLKSMSKLYGQFAHFITACELMCGTALSLVHAYLPDIFNQTKIPCNTPWALLLELSHHHPDLNIGMLLKNSLAQHCLSPHQYYAYYTTTDKEEQDKLWALRKSIPTAEAQHGPWLKNDIAVPKSHIEAFITETHKEIYQLTPDACIVCFAHVGDGNLHYNIALSPETHPEHFKSAVENIVYSQVMKHHGTISAEHGIGLTKKHLLKRSVSPTHYKLLCRIKNTFDPDHLLNPGKVLDIQEKKAQNA